MIETYVNFIDYKKHVDDVIVFNYPIRFHVGDGFDFDPSPYYGDWELMKENGFISENSKLNDIEWFAKNVEPSWTVVKVGFLTSSDGSFSQHIDIIRRD